MTHRQTGDSLALRPLRAIAVLLAVSAASAPGGALAFDSFLPFVFWFLDVRIPPSEASLQGALDLQPSSLPWFFTTDRPVSIALWESREGRETMTSTTWVDHSRIEEGETACATHVVSGGRLNDVSRFCVARTEEGVRRLKTSHFEYDGDVIAGTRVTRDELWTDGCLAASSSCAEWQESTMSECVTGRLITATRSAGGDTLHDVQTLRRDVDPDTGSFVDRVGETRCSYEFRGGFPSEVVCTVGEQPPSRWFITRGPEQWVLRSDMCREGRPCVDARVEFATTGDRIDAQEVWFDDEIFLRAEFSYGEERNAIASPPPWPERQPAGSGQQ